MAIKRLKFAGIGPQEITREASHMMAGVGRQLGHMGWLLRSGNADGSDQAWARFFPVDQREIFLPWDGFNCTRLYQGFYVSPLTEQLRTVAKMTHTHWGNISEGDKKLMMRNVSIILGPELNDPVEFVAYSHPKRKPTGSTGNAVRLAEANKIPCYNIMFEEDQMALDAKVNSYTQLA